MAASICTPPAATQKSQGTIVALAGARSFAAEPLDTRVVPGSLVQPAGATMPPAQPRLLKIEGITRDGKTFRPSDWAERLAGALSSFRPVGTGIGAHIGYSPYCVPRIVGGVKCVIVNEALRDIELMALDFVLNFARDNNLVVSEITPGDDLS
jgi:Protein of unknown function (DUF3579)